MATDKRHLSVVSSVATAMKRALTPGAQEIADIKQKHRDNLATLTTIYMDALEAGDPSVAGIRNAKDLVEVIKMDLLLIGEATERKEDMTALEATKVEKLAQGIDMDDPEVQALIDKMMGISNEVNDDADTNTPVHRHVTMDGGDTEGIE